MGWRKFFGIGGNKPAEVTPAEQHTPKPLTPAEQIVANVGSFFDVMYPDFAGTVKWAKTTGDDTVHVSRAMMSAMATSPGSFSQDGFERTTPYPDINLEIGSRGNKPTDEAKQKMCEGLKYAINRSAELGGLADRFTVSVNQSSGYFSISKQGASTFLLPELAQATQRLPQVADEIRQHQAREQAEMAKPRLAPARAVQDPVVAWLSGKEILAYSARMDGDHLVIAVGKASSRDTFMELAPGFYSSKNDIGRRGHPQTGQLEFVLPNGLEFLKRAGFTPPQQGQATNLDATLGPRWEPPQGGGRSGGGNQGRW